MNLSRTVKREYFELVKKLNQTNKLKNQETDIFFYIDSTEVDHLKLFAAISVSQKILLCERPYKLAWVEAGFSGYANLEAYLAQLIQIHDGKSNITNHIKSHIFKLMS